WNHGSMWQAGMSSAGGRPELGPYPEWTTDWLFTGDWRMREISLTLADIASSWPFHWRETDPTRRLSRLDPFGSGTGLGHTISATDRRSFQGDAGWSIFSSTIQSDAVIPVGPYAAVPSQG